VNARIYADSEQHFEWKPLLNCSRCLAAGFVEGRFSLSLSTVILELCRDSGSVGTDERAAAGKSRWGRSWRAGDYFLP